MVDEKGPWSKRAPKNVSASVPICQGSNLLDHKKVRVSSWTLVIFRANLANWRSRLLKNEAKGQLRSNYAKTLKFPSRLFGFWAVAGCGQLNLVLLQFVVVAILLTRQFVVSTIMKIIANECLDLWEVEKKKSFLKIDSFSNWKTPAIKVSFLSWCWPEFSVKIQISFPREMEFECEIRHTKNSYLGCKIDKKNPTQQKSFLIGNALQRKLEHLQK